MIVVRIELHSAVTNKVKDIGSVIISNDGPSVSYGRVDLAHFNYLARTFRAGAFKKHATEGECAWPLSRKATPTRVAEVKDHARDKVPVLTLVRKALQEMGY